MNVVQWASTCAGRRITAPGGLGGQCVDVANVYVLARGLQAVRANAVDWAAAGRLPRPWRWEPNGPSNAPPGGAVVVWGPWAAHGISVYGHIAVALAADGAALLSLDQDWPPGAGCALVWHDYGGVRGWWVPPTPS